MEGVILEPRASVTEASTVMDWRWINGFADSGLADLKGHLSERRVLPTHRHTRAQTHTNTHTMTMPTTEFNVANVEIITSQLNCLVCLMYCTVCVCVCVYAGYPLS